LSGRLLKITLWSAAAAATLGYVVLAARVLGAAAPGDPVETAVLDHAVRLAQGHAPYHDFVGAPPPGLMPGFPFAVSGLVLLFDAGLWEVRLVALLATLAAAALVARIVSSEAQSRTLGAAAGGFVLLGATLAWAGPAGARPEPLMLTLVLAACALLRYRQGVLGALAAALVMAAACFTHPAGLWFTFAALIHLGVHDRRRAVAYAAGVLLFVAGGDLALWSGFGPWFDFQAWVVPLLALRLQPLALLHFLGTQVLGTLGVLALGAVLSFALPVAPWRGAVGLWMWMALAALAAGVTASQSAGGAPDALLPVAIMLALAGPVSIQRVTRHLAAWPGSTRLGGQGLVLTALALQFLTLAAHLTPRTFLLAG